MYKYDWGSYVNLLLELLSVVMSIDYMTYAEEMYVANKDTTSAEWELLNSTTFSGTTVMMVTSYQLPHIESGLTHNVIYSHRTAIIVIMCIFVSITLTITVAILVFCRKKNAVFILQKSEPETESVYEMDDMNTECDISDQEMDIDSYNESMQCLRSQTYPKMSRLCEYELESPLPGRVLSHVTSEKTQTSNSVLPKSKTFSGLQRKRNLRESDLKFTTHKPRKFPQSNITRPTSLPLSTTFSSSGSWYNYQSMVIAADVEPWETSWSSDVCLMKPESDKFANTKYLDKNETDVLHSQSNDTQVENKQQTLKDECFNDNEEILVCMPLLHSKNRAVELDTFTLPHMPKPLNNTPSSLRDCVCNKPFLDQELSQKHSHEHDVPTKKMKSMQITPKLFTKRTSQSTSEKATTNSPEITDLTDLVTAPVSSKVKTSTEHIQGKLEFEWDTDS